LSALQRRVVPGSNERRFANERGAPGPGANLQPLKAFAPVKVLGFTWCTA
jgi:hypothetical protein